MRRKLFPRHSQDAVPAPSPDLEAILEEMRSTDERVRAEAVRKLCPCRGVDWGTHVFQRVLELRNDPSPVVRQAVEHDLEENPRWGKRSEERKLMGKRSRTEYLQVKADIEERTALDAPTPEIPTSHSLGWRTRPRRRTRKKHRLM